jgi:2-polyprenyl-6-methoxyphenol hydroxylase-like FAD-dependent oxidoreductase
MFEEAERSGVQIRLGCTVEGLDFDQTHVLVNGGEILRADLIIGADGESSAVAVCDQLITNAHMCQVCGQLRVNYCWATPLLLWKLGTWPTGLL